MDNTVDAIETEGEAACAVAARQFQVKDVCFIESNLDFYEKVFELNSVFIVVTVVYYRYR